MSALRFLLFTLTMLAVAAPAPAQTESDQTQSGQAEAGAADSTPPATQQDEATGSGVPDATQDRKQYLVEVITFQYLGPDSSGGETFDRLFVEEYLPSESFDFEEYQRVRRMVTYTEMKHLVGALEKLRLNERYRVLTNIAWTQPLLGKDEAVDVPLGYESRTGTSSVHDAAGQPIASSISGAMRVYGDYLLFVDMDLSITVPARPADAEPDVQPSESGFTSILGGTPVSESGPSPGFEVFRISERRRIKLEEFHYFDHPYFGAIVSVVRYEGEEDE